VSEYLDMAIMGSAVLLYLELLDWRMKRIEKIQKEEQKKFRDEQIEILKNFKDVKDRSDTLVKDWLDNQRLEE
jgi:hypothetical protein